MAILLLVAFGLFCLLISFLDDMKFKSEADSKRAATTRRFQERNGWLEKLSIDEHREALMEAEKGLESLCRNGYAYSITSSHISFSCEGQERSFYLDHLTPIIQHEQNCDAEAAYRIADLATNMHLIKRYNEVLATRRALSATKAREYDLEQARLKDIASKY